ncbi:MAG: UvrD-helicase domain-containing protein, partial [Syntrophomonadaceae bacterium]|nr:UvrD-helicase domain-containing protein [Syntrophomonadaceae bacterium]
MEFVADLHIHSHYSRATSRDCNPENLQQWAIYKGITLLGTGDFTHPAWREELRSKLEPAEEGFYRLRQEFCLPGLVEPPGSPVVRFVVSGEISTIYKKGGRVRKVHHLLVLPSLEAADELSRRLEDIGNIRSDGRPILGLDSSHLLEMALEVCPEVIFIPAHIWTPHFSVFGANSGFDTLEECFEDLTEHIFAAETGLSSDPPMNWRLSALDRLTLVSNSDAHSPRNLAREANLFATDLTYPAIRAALRERDPARFLGTLEFYPEEGKYHYDGHRACQVRWEPAQTRAADKICPCCGRKVTVGVLHRVEELADRPVGYQPANVPPFESLVPLPEIIAAALGVGVQSKKVDQHYFSMLAQLGPELVILRETPLEQVAAAGGVLVAEAIRRMRAGEVETLPGFDGEYGKIILLRPEERQQLLGQGSLFEETLPKAEVKAITRKTRSKAEKHDISQQVGSSHTDTDQTEALGPETVGAESSRNDAETAKSKNSSEILASLNPEQREAVTAEKGPVIVIAGPGTGKTRTLVHRIAYLIRERGVSPHHITAVTFTNKAAQEIRHRLTEILGDGAIVQAITIGTFHSICLDLLRTQRNNQALVVLDALDAQDLLQEAWPESGKKRVKGLPKIHREISFLKSCGHTFSSSAVPGELRSLYQAYQERLAEYGALDYDDILLEAVDLCETWRTASDSAAVEHEELTRFTHLLVDEFQDVNPVQYRLVKAWAGQGVNTFVIGDPDQAIYGFRGADYRFFWQLKDDYPAARVCRLTLNYRSTPTILRAASGVVTHNPENQLLADREPDLIAAHNPRKTTDHVLTDNSTVAETAPVNKASTRESLNDKVAEESMPASKPAPQLRPVRQHDAKIQHWEVASELAEGIAIVQEINRLVGGATMLQSHGQGSGLPVPNRKAEEEEARGFSDIAVLFRTSRQGEQLEECFLREGIPYRVVGRESFLAEREVREVLAFCRCLVYPEDDFHLIRCLGSTVFGLGRSGISLVREKARQIGGTAWQASIDLTESQFSSPAAVVNKLAAL